jgi:hypothetical protein
MQILVSLLNQDTAKLVAKLVSWGYKPKAEYEIFIGSYVVAKSIHSIQARKLLLFYYSGFFFFLFFLGDQDSGKQDEIFILLCFGISDVKLI